MGMSFFSRVARRTLSATWGGRGFLVGLLWVSPIFFVVFFGRSFLNWVFITRRIVFFLVFGVMGVLFLVLTGFMFSWLFIVGVWFFGKLIVAFMTWFSVLFVTGWIGFVWRRIYPGDSFFAFGWIGFVRRIICSSDFMVFLAFGWIRFVWIRICSGYFLIFFWVWIRLKKNLLELFFGLCCVWVNQICL